MYVMFSRARQYLEIQHKAERGSSNRLMQLIELPAADLVEWTDDGTDQSITELIAKVRDPARRRYFNDKLSKIRDAVTGEVLDMALTELINEINENLSRQGDHDTPF